MPRIRSIKPEFFVSEQLAECSTTARLLFVGLWVFADDNGVHPAKPKTLKAEVFPMDDFTAADVEGFMAELLRVGVVAQFTGDDGTDYWFSTGWRKHQRIEKPSYKYPTPPPQNSTSSRRPVVESIDEQSPNRFDEHSTTAHRPLTPGEEGKGEEGKGVDRSGASFNEAGEDYPRAPAPAPARVSPAGGICKQLRKAGIADVNPSHPRLVALIEAGATAEEFVDAAAKAEGKSDAFSYLLGVVEGRRRDVAKRMNGVHRGAMPRAETPGQRAARERVAAAVPNLAARPAEPAPSPTEVVDVVARQVG